MTIFTPAEGVGAQGLYDKLRAAGTRGLVAPPAPGGNAALSEPVDCNIQGAYAL